MHLRIIFFSDFLKVRVRGSIQVYLPYLDKPKKKKINKMFFSMDFSPLLNTPTKLIVHFLAFIAIRLAFDKLIP